MNARNDKCCRCGVDITIPDIEYIKFMCRRCAKNWQDEQQKRLQEYAKYTNQQSKLPKEQK